MKYVPGKYNDTSIIKNFQKRMNCYAYVLQSYYYGDGYYELYPDEIGIGVHINDKYDVNNFGELKSLYSSFESNITNIIKRLAGSYEQYMWYIKGKVENNPEFIADMNNYMTFVENQMKRDAQVMNFNINNYNNSKVINQNNCFIPPNNFNESNERVIAMVAYYLYEDLYNGSLS